MGGSAGVNSAASQPMGFGGSVSALGLGKNGVPFQAHLSHMENSGVLLSSSFPKLKRVVGV